MRAAVGQARLGPLAEQGLAGLENNILGPTAQTLIVLEGRARSIEDARIDCKRQLEIVAGRSMMRTVRRCLVAAAVVALLQSPSQGAPQTPHEDCRAITLLWRFARIYGSADLSVIEKTKDEICSAPIVPPWTG